MQPIKHQRDYFHLFALLNWTLEI